MIGIDTNVLVRYFTEDDPKQSPLAVRFVERTLNDADPGHVSLVTLAELVWVLRSRFSAQVDEIIEIVMQLLSDGRFVIQDRHAVWVALDVYRQHGVDLADALIAAINHLHGCSHTVTFDGQARRIPGMTLLR